MPAALYCLYCNVLLQRAYGLISLTHVQTGTIISDVISVQIKMNFSYRLAVPFT